MNYIYKNGFQPVNAWLIFSIDVAYHISSRTCDFVSNSSASKSQPNSLLFTQFIASIVLLLSLF